MNTREKALELYNECLDMDYMDYTETMEKDIAFIENLIQEIGIDNTRKYIRDFLND